MIKPNQVVDSDLPPELSDVPLKYLTLRKETLDSVAKTTSQKETQDASLVGKLRTSVSQDKNRFCFDGYDLDLSYITPRIIAMGLPSTGVEGLYRNRMDDVKHFFESRHKDHYMVFNLCEEVKYPDNIFFKQHYCPFKDHEAPPLNIIRPFCEVAKSFLDENDSNVVAIHCKAGKGRTGTMISSLLLYMGLFSTAKECLEYYGIMRVQNKKGVTVPSQIRYVHFFEYVLKQNLSHPIKFREAKIKTIHMITVPVFSSIGSTCTPVFTIENNDNVYNWLDNHSKKTFKEKEGGAVFPLGDEGFTVRGDFKIAFTHIGSFGKKEKMFNFWFNTNFIPSDGILEITKDMIDKACKDSKEKRFQVNFRIKVECLLDDDEIY
jgi:phosphatidylinositol-3,4,5-trisphosphate 3-phosphatase/dual-specificity protein phosphatase PTEN